MPAVYSTFVSNAILGISALYCLARLKTVAPQWNLAFLAYGFTICACSIGMMHYSNDYSELKETLEFSRLVQKLFTLPCITGQLWYNYGFGEDIAFLHLVLPILPLMYYIGNHRMKHRLVGCILTGNAISCFLVCCTNENWYGFFTALGFDLVNSIKEDDETLDLSPHEAYNYFSAFFLIIAQMAMEYSYVVYVIVVPSK